MFRITDVGSLPRTICNVLQDQGANMSTKPLIDSSNC